VSAVYVIAEAGVNHNGSVEFAHRLVDAAADAGADAVKFQTFDPAALVTETAEQAPYQVRNVGDVGSQLDMLRALVLDQNAHRELVDHCQTRGIDFLSTPFDLGSAAFLLDDLGLNRLKIGSGDLTNGPLLHQIASAGASVIMSTGMASLTEIEEALGVLVFGYEHTATPSKRSDLAEAWRTRRDHQGLRDRIVLLHCTTDYPCPIDAVNLRAMATLADVFDLPVGYSDHTEGTTVAVAAAARGACVVEKHVTLDRTMPGPDHAASVEPLELAELVEGIRTVDRALGSGDKLRAPGEEANAAVARRSLVTSRRIPAGTMLSPENVTAKRPAGGLSPMAFWDLIGRPTTRDLGRDELISVEDLSADP